MLRVLIFLVLVLFILLGKIAYWAVWGPVLLVSAKQREARRARLRRRKAIRDLSNALTSFSKGLYR